MQGSIIQNQQTPKDHGKKRGRKKAGNGYSLLFVLGEVGADGSPVISSSFTEESQALMEAMRLGVCYYRLERYVVQSEIQADGSIRTSGVSASK